MILDLSRLMLCGGRWITRQQSFAFVLAVVGFGAALFSFYLVLVFIFNYFLLVGKHQDVFVATQGLLGQMDKLSIHYYSWWDVGTKWLHFGQVCNISRLCKKTGILSGNIFDCSTHLLSPSPTELVVIPGYLIHSLLPLLRRSQMCLRTQAFTPITKGAAGLSTLRLLSKMAVTRFECEGSRSSRWHLEVEQVKAMKDPRGLNLLKTSGVKSTCSASVTR